MNAIRIGAMVMLLAGPLTTIPVMAVEEGTFMYDDHGQRDPFWKLVSQSGVITSYGTDVQISDMVLEGVIFDPRGQSLAIINGKVMKLNEQVGMYTIVEIYQDKVVLLKDEHRYILEIKKEE